MAERLRYEPLVKIASGGMATVHLGAMRGELGFRQLVAIKRPHQHLLDDEAFRSTLMTEARLAASIHHANVVAVRDIETFGDSVQLVMDYIAGASLGDLILAWSKDDGPRLAPSIAVRIVLDACAGLHAAHELTDDAGKSLGLVHRDVSPQNILVGVDGLARVADFGIAKCAEISGAPTTRGSLKGKVGYMAPEYVRGKDLDRRADVFALGVVLWESLVGKRLFRGGSEGETLERVLTMTVRPISEATTDVGAALDDVVLRALARDRDARFATAEAFGSALESAAGLAGLTATHAEVGKHVRAVAGAAIDQRARAARDRMDAPDSAIVSAAEAATRVDVPRPSTPRRSRRVIALVATIVAVAAASTAISFGIRGSRDATSTSTSTSTSTPTPTPTDTGSASTSAAATSAPSPTTSARARTDPTRPPAPPRASSTAKPTWPPPNPYPR